MEEIAIIMAAGLGNRMLPLTEKIPKPLIKVHGVPMIETIIQGLQSRGIRSIYVVTGYKKEQFIYLENKYEGLVLVENREYAEKNNISSLAAVQHLLGQSNCFICEADLYVADKEVFSKNLTETCYYGKFIWGESQDWVFDMEKDRVVRVGKCGFDCYNMVGISYWTRQDAKILRSKLMETCECAGHEQMYWDEVVDKNISAWYLTVEPVEDGQIIEVDTVEELKIVDASYRQD